MIGAQAALPLFDTSTPGGIGRPLIDIDIVADAEPGGIGMVSHLLGEPELAFQQRRPAAGVHHPAGLDLPLAALLENVQAVIVLLWLQANLLYLAAIENGNPLTWQQTTQY